MPADMDYRMKKRIQNQVDGETGWKKRLSRLTTRIGPATKAEQLVGDKIGTTDGPGEDKIRVWRTTEEVSLGKTVA